MIVETNFSIEEFPLFYHSRMLADEYRLNRYRTAIDQIIQKDNKVVDIGGGTGVLTHMLTKKTNEQIIYIEKSKSSSIVAQILSDSLDKNIQYINKSSFDVQLKYTPDVLVTETLGYFGIDEGIVEICHDFCSRHYKVKKLIPSKLCLKYQLLNIPELKDDFDLLLNTYASQFKVIPTNLVSQFEHLFCNLIRTKFLKSDTVEVCSDPKKIRQFNLGIDENSDLDFYLECKMFERANAIHFYFEAELAEGISLTNYVFDQKTHWLHSYAGVPKGSHSGKIQFSSKERKLKLRWN